MPKTLEEILARKNEIRKLLDEDPNCDVESLSKEIDELEKREREICEEEEKRSLLLKKVNTQGTLLRGFKDNEPDEELSIDSHEYRNAFFKSLAGKDLNAKEARALKTGITGATEGTGTVATDKSVLVPTQTLNKIWSKIDELHPILNDVNRLPSGTAISILVHSKSNEANIVEEGAEGNEAVEQFIEIVLGGKDFTDFIDISYRMLNMSIDALEQYLIDNIAKKIGNKMAKDVIATIKATSEINKTTSAKAKVLVYNDVTDAFGTLSNASTIKVYGKRKTIYSYLVGMVDDTKRPIFQNPITADANGSVLGSEVKIEDAMGDNELLICDPMNFTHNIVTDILIERDNDIKKHVVTFSGYACAEGAVVDERAFNLLTIKQD